MRNVFLTVILSVAFLISCDTVGTKNANEFTILANISGVEDSTLVTLNVIRDRDLTPIDTAYINNAQVRFSGKLENPEIVYLKIGDTRKYVNFFGENSDISVAVNIDSLDNAVVTGSSVHDDLMAFKTFLEPIDIRSEEINNAYDEAVEKGDQEKVNKILEDYDALRLEQTEMIRSFVAERPNSYISPYLIKSYLVYDLDFSQLESLLVGLDSSIYDSKDYQAMAERVEILKKVAVGSPATEFVLNDTTGNPLALSSFKGKYLLIDFWASWCGPCRRENPNVVALYNEYKNKNFEILGVSFDEDKNRWINAIDQDELAWSQVSDLKGWGSAAGKLYGINSIPATVLLNPDGIIIAKNLRGEDLRKKLEEIYAEEDQNI